MWDVRSDAITQVCRLKEHHFGVQCVVRGVCGVRGVMGGMCVWCEGCDRRDVLGEMCVV